MNYQKITRNSSFLKILSIKQTRNLHVSIGKAVENIHGGEKTPHILMLYELRSNLKFFK